jgi:hypothetical protein
MEIINNKLERIVNDIDDKYFMKFISQNGVSEYPTIILLLNRIFYRDKDRGGEHVGITMKIKKEDNVVWYHVPKESVISYLLSFFITDTRENINNNFNIGNDENTYWKQKISIESFFKEDSSLHPISAYFKSNNLYYINDSSNLYIGVNPFDEFYQHLFFPEDNAVSDNAHNIIDVLSLDDTIDLILTNSRLYTYNNRTDSFDIKFILPNGNATSMCMLKNYFIITSDAGIYIFKNIKSDVELIYEFITSLHDGTTDNGLPEDNHFTYSLPIPNSNSVLVNGVGDNSCIFDCVTKMGQASDKPNGISSRHFDSRPMLFFSDFALDTDGNVYKVTASNYVVYNDFIFFTLKDSPFITIFRYNAPESSIIFSCQDNISNVFMDNYTVYLLGSDAKIYRSLINGNKEIGFYFIFFDYTQFKLKEKEGKPNKKIDIRKSEPTVFTYLNILKSYNDLMAHENDYAQNLNTLFDGIDINNVDFIFYITGNENKKNWIMFGDDERKDDTFKKLAEAFDIG